MINSDLFPVPQNNIVVITDHDEFQSSVEQIVVPLKGMIKRDWFSNHAYHCLPLVIGNQYGFGIRCINGFTARWDGGDWITNTTIRMDTKPQLQFVNSHFGNGIITVQNRFHFRTPRGVNLMTINPPNIVLPYLTNLMAVIETDNLRRDFTFNLKITVPNVDVRVNAGDIIAAFIPTPRYFVDGFELVHANTLYSADLIEQERAQGRKFAQERNEVDIHKPHRNGRRYFHGEDADGNKFWDHQKKLVGQ